MDVSEFSYVCYCNYWHSVANTNTPKHYAKTALFWNVEPLNFVYTVTDISQNLATYFFRLVYHTRSSVVRQMFWIANTLEFTV